MKTKFKQWQVVKVSWIDSSSQDGWQSELYTDLDEKFLQIETVGYFFKETKNSVAIVQSYTPPRERKSLHGIIQIPKVAIKKMSKL
jgi:hypothetical protein